MDRRSMVVALPLLAYFLLTAVASEPLQQEKNEFFLGQSSDLTVAHMETSLEDLGFQATGTDSAGASGDLDGELGFTEGGEAEEDDEDEDEEGEVDDSATNEEENRGRRRMMLAPITAMSREEYLKIKEEGRILPVLSGGGNSALRTLRIRGRKGKGKGKGRRRSPQVRLRSAINDANRQGGRTVTFILTGDVFLSSELPLLVGSLSVVGACKTPEGKSRPCVIDGRRRFPIFKASVSQTFCQLNISNLILQNALGGAYTGDAKQQFAATCDLIADQVTFRNNKNAAGGAIFMLGVYKLSRCLFEGNSADGDGGAIVAGDQAGFYLAPALGSYIAGTGYISRTTFRKNVAGLNPNWLNPGSGGAVAHFGGPTLSIFRTIFASNRAGVKPLTGRGPRSPAAAVSGGGLHFRAGDNVTIIRSVFRGNVAPEGGAVYAAPLLQYDQWAQPVGPNIWGKASFCRPIFEKNSATRFADVSINATYAYDRGMIEARFCPAAPRGAGTARPSKVRIITRKKCNRCRFG